MPRATFVEKFDALVRERGFNSITDFVDDWIVGGGTFKSLYEFVLLNGIKVHKYTVWFYLRPYLTEPYGKDDGFWYKWNSIAQTKGESNIIDYMEKYRKKLTTKEIAIELGVKLRSAQILIEKINLMTGAPPKKKKYDRHKNRDGFSVAAAREKWQKVVEENGYRTLKTAIIGMRESGKTIEEIADIFGVNTGTLYYRLEVAKITMPKRGKKVKNG